MPKTEVAPGLIPKTDVTLHESKHPQYYKDVKNKVLLERYS